MNDRRLHLVDDTRATHLQGRQYALFGLDLGDGIIRDHLVLGSVIVVSWVAADLFLLGFPSSYIGWALLMFPPWFATAAALRLDRGGRPSYALWWCRLRYLARRHRPLIPPLGQAPVHRSMARLEPLLRPTRTRPGRPFTVRTGRIAVISVPVPTPEKAT